MYRKEKQHILLTVTVYNGGGCGLKQRVIWEIWSFWLVATQLLVVHFSNAPLKFSASWFGFSWLIIEVMLKFLQPKNHCHCHCRASALQVRRLPDADQDHQNGDERWPAVLQVSTTAVCCCWADLSHCQLLSSQRWGTATREWHSGVQGGVHS